MFGTTSDSHLGHPRVPSKYVTQALVRAFPDDETTEELDFIIIAGDLFDRMVSMASDEAMHIVTWMASFLETCSRRKVRVRVLEGTPSHDRKQSRLLTAVNDALGDNAADLRYVDTLSIEYEEEFDFHMLYVPDEWHHDHDEVKRQVQQLLRAHGLDRVDITVFHGMFRHQVKEGLMIPSHDPDFYSEITNWFVTAGHIHTSSIYKNIFAQGSIERLSMNEEEDKGHFRLKVSRDDIEPVTSKFIVNTKAMFQRTVDIRGLEMENAIEIIDREIAGVQVGYCRLHMTADLAAVGILKSMTERHPHLRWSKKLEKDKSKKLEEADVFDVRKLVDAKPINKQTIEELMAEKMAEWAEDAKFIKWETNNGKDMFRRVLSEVIDD